MKTLPLSFRTAHQLHGLTELLPSGPEWQCWVLSPKVPTKSPLGLFYHYPVKCLEALFNHPLFHDKLDLIPRHVYQTAQRLVRVYSEWMTGNAAWEMQVWFCTSFHVDTDHVTRVKYLPAPPFSVWFSHLTKQTYLLSLVINVPTCFYSALQTYTCPPV